MSLRDIVSGQACDDGTGGYRNPLARFTDTIYRDRSQREQQEWQNFQPQQQGINTQLEDRLSTQTAMRGPFSEEKYFQSNFGDFSQPRGMDSLNPLGLDYDEFEDFMGGQGGMEEGFHMNNMGPVSNELPPELLKEYIKSFIDASHSQAQFRPMTLPDFGFSEMDKMKIKNRTEVFAKHMYANQNSRFVEKQANSFINSFMNGRMSSHGPRFEDPGMIEEFTQMNRLEESDLERFYQESNRTQELVDEFHSAYGPEADMERYYREAQETGQWVDEFEGHRPIERVSNLRDITETITQIKDPKLQNTNFMRFMSKINKGEVAFVGDQVIEKEPSESELDANRWAREFESGQDPSVLGRDDERTAEEWARDFQERYSGATDEFGNPEGWADEFENDEQTEWMEKIFSKFQNQDEYVFTDPADNPYMSHPNPFEKGVKLFDDGKISESILAFEAELQRDSSNALCWRMLGQAHAENDKDTTAIVALKNSINFDPSDDASHLALAVSYTNEMYRDEALDTLKKWLQNRPEYSNIPFHAPDFSKEGYNFRLHHNAVTDMFIQAAQMMENEPDPDVQTALGLLFNLSLDYDKAVDCFKTALSVRPEDYLLWNKLGATLANSNHSEEALGCYFRALKTKPSYVRARSNVGISFMALKEYEKAAQYFLGALALHPEAKHVWLNLRMVFAYMERKDLLNKCTSEDVEAFREDFEF